VVEWCGVQRLVIPGVLPMSAIIGHGIQAATPETTGTSNVKDLDTAEGDHGLSTRLYYAMHLFHHLILRYYELTSLQFGVVRVGRSVMAHEVKRAIA
jgi:hypothetical protein